MLRPCAHQVGGHLKDDKSPDTLVDEEGRFYKPLQDARGEREAAFYQAVWQPPALAAPPQGCVACEPVAPWGSGPLYGPMQAEPRPEDLAALRPFVPSYYGLVEAGGRKYVVLQDACRAYAQPCVMDVKMGYTALYPWGSEKYQAKTLAKDAGTTQGTLGFRVCGLQVYDGANGCTRKMERAWCQALTADRIQEPFALFAGALGPRALYHDPAHGVVPQLQRLRAWLDSQRSCLFYNASLLFTYEGTARAAADARVQVHLIDFAHTFPSMGKCDMNVLSGLDSLTHVLGQTA